MIACRDTDLINTAAVATMVSKLVIKKAPRRKQIIRNTNEAKPIMADIHRAGILLIGCNVSARNMQTQSYVS